LSWGREDITAFWYQEEPHRAFALPSIAQHIAASNAGEKK
jgi:hypothetical protein